jgi:hypothetical protein
MKHLLSILDHFVSLRVAMGCNRSLRMQTHIDGHREGQPTGATQVPQEANVARLIDLVKFYLPSATAFLPQKLDQGS